MYLLMHLITGYIFLIIGFIKQTGGVDTVILCINTLVFAMSVVNMLKNNNLEKTIRGKKTLFKNTKALGILREINERKVPEYADIKLSNTTINKLTGNGWQPVISGTFTALGVLGTFLGLSIGLGSLGMTTAEILDNIDKLIPGITTAFTTSIVGLGMSTSYNFWFRGQQLRLYYAIDEYKNKFNKFGGRIDAPETVEGLNSVLTNFCHQSKIIIEHMQEMTEKAEDRIEQALYIFEKNIDDKLASYENMLHNTNTIYINGVNEVITKFRDETIEGVRSQLELYREDAEAWVKIVSEQQNNITKNIEGLSSTGETITGNISDISKSIADTYSKLDTVNSELGDTVEKLVNNTKDLKDAIDKSDETIKEHLVGIAESMNKASDTCKETNSTIALQINTLNNVAGKIEESNACIEKQTLEIAKNREDVTSATTQLNNELKQALVEADRIVKSADESFGKTIESLGDKVRDDIIKVTGDRIKDIASKSEDKISRDIQKVVEEEAKSAEIILKLLESTSNKLLEYTELMETINKATPNLKYSKEAAKMLNDDLEKIAVYMEKIKNIVEKLSDNDER